MRELLTCLDSAASLGCAGLLLNSVCEQDPFGLKLVCGDACRCWREELRSIPGADGEQVSAVALIIFVYAYDERFVFQVWASGAEFWSYQLYRFS